MNLVGSSAVDGEPAQQLLTCSVNDLPVIVSPSDMLILQPEFRRSLGFTQHEPQ